MLESSETSDLLPPERKGPLDVENNLRMRPVRCISTVKKLRTPQKGGNYWPAVLFGRRRVQVGVTQWGRRFVAPDAFTTCQTKIYLTS